MKLSEFTKTKTIKGNTFHYHPGRKGWFYLTPIGWIPAVLGARK